MQLEVEENGHAGLCHAAYPQPHGIEELHAELDVTMLGLSSCARRVARSRSGVSMAMQRGLTAVMPPFDTP